ncbi:MAG: GNAT family N-acetyltransferase [Acetatifactor sp.]|nr:GNAT family N-acetyltransferase [Acetatifactor sp.]
MVSPYEKCPIFENENYQLRLVEVSDAPDLLLVYSDEKAVPFFNSDNCNGDDFHYTTLERMQSAIDFWLWAYRDKGFVRWAIVDKNTRQAVGTIELFNRRAIDGQKPSDYFNECGLLRLDLRSDYEYADRIQEILSLIVPPAFELFACQMIATKIPPFATQRKVAAEQLGFALSEEKLIGGDDNRVYTDYFVLLK